MAQGEDTRAATLHDSLKEAKSAVKWADMRRPEGNRRSLSIRSEFERTPGDQQFSHLAAATLEGGVICEFRISEEHGKVTRAG